METVEIKNNRVPSAKNVLRALLSRDEVPIKLSYAAKRTFDEVQEEERALQEFKREQLEGYVKREEGEIVTDEEGAPVFKDEEAEQEFNEQVMELYNSDTSIDAHKASMSDIGGHKLPPSWAVFIDFMFRGYEEGTEEFTGAEVETYCNSLEEILGESEETEEMPLGLTVPASISYRNLTEIRDDINERRMELLKEHAVTDEDGEIVNATDEDGNETQRAKFESDEDREEFQETLNEEVYSEDYDVEVARVDMEHTQGVNLPGQQVFVLDWMFTD